MSEPYLPTGESLLEELGLTEDDISKLICRMGVLLVATQVKIKETMSPFITIIPHWGFSVRTLTTAIHSIFTTQNPAPMHVEFSLGEKKFWVCTSLSSQN